MKGSSPSLWVIHSTVKQLLFLRFFITYSLILPSCKSCNFSYCSTFCTLQWWRTTPNLFIFLTFFVCWIEIIQLKIGKRSWWRHLSYQVWLHFHYIYFNIFRWLWRFISISCSYNCEPLYLNASRAVPPKICNINLYTMGLLNIFMEIYM